MISSADFISQIDHRSVINYCIARKSAAVFDPVIHVGHHRYRAQVRLASILERTYGRLLSLVTGIDATRVVAIYGLDIFVGIHEQALGLGLLSSPNSSPSIAHRVVIVSVGNHEPVAASGWVALVVAPKRSRGKG